VNGSDRTISRVTNVRQCAKLRPPLLS